jgi:hypothetical protein
MPSVAEDLGGGGGEVVEVEETLMLTKAFRRCIQEITELQRHS